MSTRRTRSHVDRSLLAASFGSGAVQYTPQRSKSNSGIASRQKALLMKLNGGNNTSEPPAPVKKTPAVKAQPVVVEDVTETEVDLTETSAWDDREADVDARHVFNASLSSLREDAPATIQEVKEETPVATPAPVSKPVRKMEQERPTIEQKKPSPPETKSRRDVMKESSSSSQSDSIRHLARLYELADDNNHLTAYQRERRDLAYTKYMNHGMPTKKNLIKLGVKEGLTKEDIDLLPWMRGNFIVNRSAMI